MRFQKKFILSLFCGWFDSFGSFYHEFYVLDSARSSGRLTGRDRGHKRQDGAIQARSKYYNLLTFRKLQCSFFSNRIETVCHIIHRLVLVRYKYNLNYH